jgi:hypothetical protein
VSRCSRCAKLREDCLKAMDKHTIGRRPEIETIKAHNREESAYQAYMIAHRICTDCSRIDLD